MFVTASSSRAWPAPTAPETGGTGMPMKRARDKLGVAHKAPDVAVRQEHRELVLLGALLTQCVVQVNILPLVGIFSIQVQLAQEAARL